MSADPNTRPQHMSIHSQDDYELLAHAKQCLESIKATAKELSRRGNRLILINEEFKTAQEFDFRKCWIKMEIR